jgi:hypothetical protein
VSAAIGFPQRQVLANVRAKTTSRWYTPAPTCFRLAVSRLRSARPHPGRRWPTSGVSASTLTLPLFNRTVGFEYVKQGQYANGPIHKATRNPGAYIVRSGLRSRILDLDFAYGRANISSSISRRQRPTRMLVLTAKRSSTARCSWARRSSTAITIMGTTGPLLCRGQARLRLQRHGSLAAPALRRIPLDFMFYRAKGTDDIDWAGLHHWHGLQPDARPRPGIEDGRYDVPARPIHQTTTDWAPTSASKPRRSKSHNTKRPASAGAFLFAVCALRSTTTHNLRYP